MSFDILEDENEQEMPDPNTANRKISVNVKVTGLLLAHKLGLCTHEEMTCASKALAQCVGAIWVTFDEERHIRHAVYKDCLLEVVIEISCHTASIKEWTRFFTIVKSSAKKMVKKRKRSWLPF